MPRFRIVAWSLALVTLVIYLPVRTAGFVYDDLDYVVNNPIVQKGLSWAGVRWAFTTSHSAAWHPLTWLSLMLDCQLFGLDPGAQHVVNVLFHSVNAVLLLLLLFRLTGELWPGAFAAALFAWHPLRVESVAWIVERKDVLSAFFALLSLLAYTRHAKERSGGAGKPKWSRDCSLALLFFALALLAKSMLVTLPFVYLLLDCWPLKRFSFSHFSPPVFLRLVREKWPFFALSAASCLATLWAGRHGGGIRTFQQVSLAYRLENIPVAYALYLWKTIWPANLAVFYPLPEQIPPLAVAVSFAVLLGISIAVWRSRKSRPYLLVGWLWFLGTLVPVIGLVQLGSQALADRYSYFPLIGVSIAFAFGMRDLANHLRLPKGVIAGAAVMVFAGCILATENQLPYWQDNKSLFRHDLAVAPDNTVARFWVGMAFQEDHDYTNALAEFRRAEQLDPDFMSTHFMIGGLLKDLGKPEDALTEYHEALQIEPNNPAVHDRIGLLLAGLGRYDEAITEFKTAAQSDATDQWPHFHLGKLLATQGRDAAALAEFREALRMDPDNYQFLAYAAELLAASEDPQVRDGPNALACALKAVALTKNTQPFALDVLGMAYAETGRFDEAQQAAQKAIDLAGTAKPEQLDSLRQRLARYQNHQPWRQSFRSSNAPL
jgi:tetratricopeptide (TPR) repeat protein